MKKTILTLAALSVSAFAFGCHDDKPHDYGQQRPDIDRLDSRDRGLQSKDVVNASDQMTQDFLALPELNASDRRWTVVFTGVKNQTMTHRGSLDVFTSRLRANVAKFARDRVQLVQNRDEYRELQGRELEGERDDFGQGGGANPNPRGVQPDFALSAIARDLPNVGTTYYSIEFTLTDLRNRLVVWTGEYTVRVAN